MYAGRTFFPSMTAILCPPAPDDVFEVFLVDNDFDCFHDFFLCVVFVLLRLLNGLVFSVAVLFYVEG